MLRLPMAENGVILEGKGLSRRYGHRWAVAGVNVRLSLGRSLLIAGHNGAGKTTLLRLLATTLRPTEGELTVAGVNAGEDPLAARRHVAMLAQRNGLYLELSALENLRILERLRGHSRDDERANAVLKRVGLAGREHEQVRRFSSGMRKRLAFAKVLLDDAKILMFDEPYGQLDPAGFDFVDDLLREMVAEQRCVVVVTHLIERAMPILHSGLVLDDGKPIWVGPANEMPSSARDA